MSTVVTAVSGTSGKDFLGRVVGQPTWKTPDWFPRRGLDDPASDESNYGMWAGGGKSIQGVRYMTSSKQRKWTRRQFKKAVKKGLIKMEQSVLVNVYPVATERDLASDSTELTLTVEYDAEIASDQSQKENT